VPLHIIDSPGAPVMTMAIVIVTALFARPDRAESQGAPEGRRAESHPDPDPESEQEPTPESEQEPTPESLHAGAGLYSRWKIDRAQVEAALGELLGRRPAVLAAQLAPLPMWRTPAIEQEWFVRMAELGERLRVAIRAREDGVSIMFPDAEHTTRWIDEWITARWGAPARKDRCLLWIDPVQQNQVSRCRMVMFPDPESDFVVLEWSHYLTPREWVGSRRERLGMEPFPLMGASRKRMDQLTAYRHSAHRFVPHHYEPRWIWHAPRVGPGVWEVRIEADGVDHVDRWMTIVSTDPAPVIQLLRAKYGSPAYDSGRCSPPFHNGRIGDGLRWEVDGQNIEVDCSDDGVFISVDPLQR
jgi:hypothetical protein